MGVEENYVKLEIGKSSRHRYDLFAWQSHSITDPELGFSKTVRALVFHVYMLDGTPADTIFSLISTKAQKEIEPYLFTEKFRRYEFTWLKEGPGFAAPRLVNVSPL